MADTTNIPAPAQTGGVAGYLEQNGYTISPEEKHQKELGASTLTALDEMRQKRAAMGMLTAFDDLLKLLFGIEDDTNGIDGPSSEPAPEGSRYHGGMYTLDGTTRAEPTLAQLKAIEAVTPGTGITHTVNLANALLGFHETDGNNHGAIVRFCCDGQDGMPWCAGFVQKIMPPGVYDKTLSARSYLEQAKKYNAVIEPGNQPHIGDTVVFSRGKNGAQGHVGVITNVAEDGTVTMVAGNSHDAVSQSSFNYHNPPASLLGYGDTQEIARKKGIALEAPAVASGKVPNVKVAQYNDAAAARG